MKCLTGVVVCGADRFGKYVSIKADGYSQNVFRDYTDMVADIEKAYERYNNIVGMVRWIVVMK